MIPKINPDHLAPRKVRLKARYDKWRPIVRQETFERDGGRCRCCGKALNLNDDRHWMHANIHETEGPRIVAAVSRPKCITLCHDCHFAVERNDMSLEILFPALGTDAAVSFDGTVPGTTPLQVREHYRSEPLIADYQGVTVPEI